MHICSFVVGFLTDFLTVLAGQKEKKSEAISALEKKPIKSYILHHKCKLTNNKKGLM